MNKNNLLEIVDFMKKNKNFSDFNIVNDFLFDLNFTKYKSNNQIGGSAINQQPMNMNMNNQQPMNMNMNNQPMNMNMNNQPMNMNNQPPISNQLQMNMNNQQPLNMNMNNGVLQSGQVINPQQQVKFNIEESIKTLGENTDHLGVNTDECVYTRIKNPDGTYIQQKICDQKIVTMPDMFLPKLSFTYSGINTYTIKKGTILYHATVNKRGFNPNEIKLGKDLLISFFTPNFRLASDKIEGCSINKQKGFIHVFEVTRDIPEIFIKLPYDTEEDLDLDDLKNNFCNGNQNYKGVGFFYPKNEIELFNNSVFNQRTQEMHESLDDLNYYSEFALCNPNDYLNYVYTQKCMSLRKLSQPYRFDNKRYN